MAQESAVTVLGLGSMGFAQARALLKRGHAVTVWNRTAEKAAPLVSEGAKLARSPAEAVAASPLVIMCVLDYAAANGILAEPGVARQCREKLHRSHRGPGERDESCQTLRRCGPTVAP
jgi:3-hydroxyisobutyrate dehydrogenase-like beta-hydroxyacid dehydrogenase